MFSATSVLVYNGVVFVFRWFQGKLSREKAEEKLQEIQFDCFLVRESENRVGEYALSLRHDGIIKHFRIDTKRGLIPRYELYGAKRSFPSLDVLVDYYSHHCISSGGELLVKPYSTEVCAAGEKLYFYDNYYLVRKTSKVQQFLKENYPVYDVLSHLWKQFQ